VIVAKILRSTGFAGLVGYVLGPVKQIRPEQVMTRNIFHLAGGAAEMEAVAGRSTRVKDPVCHIIVAWSKDERVDVRRQLEAGRKLLSALDLSEHQALVVVHEEPKDGLVPGPGGRHYEMHIVVNRVHPDGSVNRMPHSYPRAEVAAKRIALELGFAVVPGRFNGAALDTPGLGETIGAIKAETGRPTIADELLGDPTVMETLRKARAAGWPALLGAFADNGLIVAPPPADKAASRGRARRGLHRGLVMIDAAEPDRRIKLSALDSPYEKWGAVALERELGPVPYDKIPMFERLARKASANRGHTRAAPAGMVQAPGRDEYGGFMVEKAKAAISRKAQVEAGKRRRSRIYLEAREEQERLLGRADLRRKLVRLVCGRRSMVGAAINTVLDATLNIELHRFRARRDQAVAALNTELARDRIAIPRWSDWQRRVVQNDKPLASSGRVLPLPTRPPLRASPSHGRPIFGAPHRPFQSPFHRAPGASPRNHPIQRR